MTSFEFAGFTLDPSQRRLRAGVREIDLRSKSFDVLHFLLGRAGKLVTKDEIISAAWPNVVATDDSLAQCISDIRRALGDSRHRIVKTVPGRGYMLAVPVLRRDAGEHSGPLGKEASHGRKSLVRRRLGLIVGGLLAIAVIGLGIAAERWIGDGSAERPPTTGLSIVVLPFDSLTTDADWDYVADAFTEDLITDLSRIRDAFVIARRTSFTYKNTPVDVKKLAADLGVRYVLEGSVRRIGDHVRVNAQLIDGKTGGHVWSSRYDRPPDELFAIQGTLTGQIAAVLKAKLREAESRRQRPTTRLRAWDYALRGNVRLFNPSGVADFQEAKHLLDEAIRLDPSISSAWSGLAFVEYAASLRPIPGVSVPESKQLSLAAAEKAVSLDPSNAEGHWVAGVGYARNGQPMRGLASCDTAMQINPNNDCAYICAALANMAAGRPSAAIPHFETSLRLNPRFRPFVKYTYMGIAHIQNGEDDQAVSVLTRAVSEAPSDPLANFALVAALSLSGRDEDARSVLQNAKASGAVASSTVAELHAKLSWMGPGFDRVLDGLRRAGLQER